MQTELRTTDHCKQILEIPGVANWLNQLLSTTRVDVKVYARVGADCWDNVLWTLTESEHLLLMVEV